MEKYPKADKPILSSVNQEQHIHVKNRKRVDVTGVKKIESFDSETFLLHTSLGMLLIRGSQLQLNNLNVDEETVHIGGKINEFIYVDESESPAVEKGFFGRMFS